VETKGSKNRAADVINIADYRKRVPQTKRGDSALPVIGMPMLLPIFCGFGWFILPVMVAIFDDGEARV
jgi:hypothetical protein